MFCCRGLAKYSKIIELSNWSGGKEKVTFKKYVDGRIKFEWGSYIFLLKKVCYDEETEAWYYVLLCDEEDTGLRIEKRGPNYWSGFRYHDSFSREGKTPEAVAVKLVANLF
jgi:hypothetical protein